MVLDHEEYMRRHDAAVAAAEARERAVEHSLMNPGTWASGWTGGIDEGSIHHLVRCPHCNGLDVAPRSVQRRVDGPTLVKGAEGDVIWEETFVFAGPGGHEERETATATGPMRVVRHRIHLPRLRRRVLVRLPVAARAAQRDAGDRVPILLIDARKEKPATSEEGCRLKL